MRWIKPGDYTRKNVDKAGEITIKKRKINNSKEEIDAFDTFNNWRASHAYPMHIIMKNLKRMAKFIDSNAICVQRLKRSKSIIIKLMRFKNMKLSRIQDIGGCRVVMSDVRLARELSQRYISNNNKRHKRIKSREQNYINNPKSDGYRSIHLVYGYHSINKVGKIFNGRLIEIQIRSKLQHIWATALETVDLFAYQTMKFGGGDSAWKYFFKLVSSAFALKEHCPPVPETPTDKKELYSEIKRMSKELKVIEKMIAWRSTVEHLSAKKNALFVLRLDMNSKQISYSPFKNNKEGWEKANEEYLREEKKYRENKTCDVVLVGADNINDLTYGYKNYFADTHEFLRHLKEIINS